MPSLQVKGKVANSIATQTGKGLVKVWEKQDFRGKDKWVLWTCWFDLPQLHLGENDEVILDGDLSTKVGSYEKDGETKTVVEHHLNNVSIKSHTPTTVNPEVQGAANFMLNDRMEAMGAERIFDETPF